MLSLLESYAPIVLADLPGPGGYFVFSCARTLNTSQRLRRLWLHRLFAGKTDVFKLEAPRDVGEIDCIVVTSDGNSVDCCDYHIPSFGCYMYQLHSGILDTIFTCKCIRAWLGLGATGFGLHMLHPEWLLNALEIQAPGGGVCFFLCYLLLI